MTTQRLSITCAFLLSICSLTAPSTLSAEQTSHIQKQLRLAPRAARDYDTHFNLLPSEEQQETGNAVPVLLRIVCERQVFMEKFYPRFREFAEMDVYDPRLDELPFDYFAKQIIRAGSMSDANWQYPLRSERPYLILLPDIQSQRQFLGSGMTAWIKQRLSKGKLDEALVGIQAQLACGRHCAATPILVCHLVGMSIANLALDNLELAVRMGDCPNMYWSLAALSPTLHDLGPMVRWELWAMPTRLSEPLPAIGDEAWSRITRRFIEYATEIDEAIYSKEEAEELRKNLDRLAKQELSTSASFSEAEVERMSMDERIMRWLYYHDRRFRSRVEPLAYQSPIQIIATVQEIDAESKELLAATGSKSSLYPVRLPKGILACRNFERRVKFLQTIEAIRDYASKHDGGFPPSLNDLDLAAPNDPFTNKLFVYEVNEKSARLRQAEIEGFETALYDYELTVK